MSPPTLQLVPDFHVPKPGATGTHQLNLLFPGEDSGGAEVRAGRGGCRERGAELVLAVCSLGGRKGEEGSDALKERGIGQGWGQIGAASTNY